MMEFLNNIWSTLITPNELLTKLIALPFTFLEIYLTMTLFLNILNIPTTKFKKQLYVILMSLVSIIDTFLIPSPFCVFINYFMCFILILLIFKLSLFKTLISVVIFTSVYGLIGSLTLNPYITIFNIKTEQLANIPIYNITYLLITYFILFVLILLLKKFYINMNILENINKRNKLIILLNLSFGIVTLILQAYVLFYYVDILPMFITFLSFISLFAYFAISIYSLTRVMKLSIATQKLESAEEYNRTLHILHDNVRGFKHDFDNIVTTIGGYIKTNDMEGLEKYYAELVDDCQKVNNLYILNPEIINNPGVYNLLANKYHEAVSKGIKVNMTFLLDLKELKMKIYEFARILGILLDNAIEASSECEEKIINITFRNDQKNNRQLIIIENTYSNKEVNTSTIFGKGVSEKENHTGLGLWEVQNILKKSSNLSLYTSKTNKFFSQQLEIY